MSVRFADDALQIEPQNATAGDFKRDALNLLGANPVWTDESRFSSAHGSYVTARSYAVLRRWKRALKFANRTLAADPSYLPARSIALLCQAMTGKGEQAERELRFHFEVERQAVAGRYFAVLLEERERYDEAEEVLSECVRLRPELVSHRRALYDFLARRGKWDKAEAALSVALDRWPNHPRLNIALSHSLIRQGRRDEAVALLATRFAKAPTDLDNARTLQVLYFREGRVIAAIVTLISNVRAFVKATSA